MEEIKKYKLLALLVMGVMVFLISRKLFISLFLIFLGGFFVLTFGKNIYAKDIKVVKFGVTVGILFIILGIICLFL